MPTSAWKPVVHSLVLVQVTVTPGVAAAAGMATAIPAVPSTSDRPAIAAMSDFLRRANAFIGPLFRTQRQAAGSTTTLISTIGHRLCFVSTHGRRAAQNHNTLRDAPNDIRHVPTVADSDSRHAIATKTHVDAGWLLACGQASSIPQIERHKLYWPSQTDRKCTERASTECIIRLIQDSTANGGGARDY
jgi:hypothetical protein